MGQAVRRPGGHRDRGAVLILVLVLIVISSLIVVPILGYAVSVLRANQVVSERTAHVEAVKAGLRYAMAEPQDVYEACNPSAAGINNGPLLPTPGLDIGTETRCFLLEERSAAEQEALPFSVATTYAGKVPPAGPGVIEPIYPGSGAADPTTWLADSSRVFAPDVVWLPNLPVHALNLRSAAGYLMPAGYPQNGYSECTVYFPGTYKSDLVIDGPTYFASGVYYFEREVRFVGGADAVAGSGTHEGCIDDQFAAFYATDAPATHNVTGLGVTFVLGDEARLVADNTAGPVTLRMNQRYVAPNDTGGAPSAKVSIMTVNGALDEVLAQTNLAAAGLDLELPGAPDAPQLVVPLSEVGSVEPYRVAPADNYLPSVHTPKPRQPFEPLNVTARAFNAAVIVSWDAPVSDGGSPITKYVVTTPQGAFTCETTGQRSCAIQGLNTATTYTFVVTATNAIAPFDSEPSLPSTGVRPNVATSLVVPSSPPAVAIRQADVPVLNESRYQDALVVSWADETNTNAAPVRRYDVVVTDITDPLLPVVLPVCTAVNTFTCTISGLTPPNPAATPTPYLPRYSVSVTANNIVGSSPPAALPAVTLAPPPTGELYVAPVPGPHPPYTPPPVVDFRPTSAAHVVTLDVPGYVSAPQGVVAVSAPTGSTASIKLDGGVLAAWVLLGETLPNEFSLGLTNPKTQRVIRLLTTATDGSHIRSDAVVQINETGGWAVNTWVIQ